MNKKILAFFCAVTVACSLSACGNNNKNSSSTTSDTQSTTGEPQPSSSTAESNVSSSEVKDGTEMLADGSKLTIKGDTITVQKDDDVGTITSIYEFKNDTLQSCKTNFSNVKSKEFIENLKANASKDGCEVISSDTDDATITIKLNDEGVQQVREELTSKAVTVEKINEMASNAENSEK